MVAGARVRRCQISLDEHAAVCRRHFGSATYVGHKHCPIQLCQRDPTLLTLTGFNAFCCVQARHSIEGVAVYVRPYTLP